MRVVFIARLPAWHTLHCDSAASGASLNRPRGGGWGCCEVSPNLCQVWLPPFPTFHRPVPSGTDTQPVLQQEGQELEKSFPTAAGHHPLKGEHPLSRAGSRLGLGDWLLHPQRALGFILKLPRHLEGRGGEAGEGVPPGGWSPPEEKEQAGRKDAGEERREGLGLSGCRHAHLPVDPVLVALGVWRGVQEGQPQQEPWWW